MLLTAAGNVVGIDLEETRTSVKATESTHPLDVLFKKASQAQRLLYNPVLALVRFRAAPLSAEEAVQAAALELDAIVINDRLRLFASMMARNCPKP